VAKRNQDRQKEAAMTENTPSPLGNVISIDDERIKTHLDRVVRGTVEETLNGRTNPTDSGRENSQRATMQPP
jgi:hypothetical protein